MLANASSSYRASLPFICPIFTLFLPCFSLHSLLREISGAVAAKGSPASFVCATWCWASSYLAENEAEYNSESEPRQVYSLGCLSFTFTIYHLSCGCVGRTSASIGARLGTKVQKNCIWSTCFLFWEQLGGKWNFWKIFKKWFQFWQKDLALIYWSYSLATFGFTQRTQTCTTLSLTVPWNTSMSETWDNSSLLLGWNTEQSQCLCVYLKSSTSFSPKGLASSLGSMLR